MVSLSELGSLSEPERVRLTGELVELLRGAATNSIERAFITIDSTPLLGSMGLVWEVPYNNEMTVSQFLNGIWYQMRPYVRPYTYKTGWVLCDKATQEIFEELGRPWAKKKGLLEDERKLDEIKIKAGMEIQVRPGPKSKEALDRSWHQRAA